MASWQDEHIAHIRSKVASMAVEPEGWTLATVGCHWCRTLPDGRQASISSWTSPHLPSEPGYRSGYSLVIDRQVIGSDYESLAEAIAAAEV